MPVAVHYFVMQICIFVLKLGRNMNYMDLVGYRYHKFVKLLTWGGDASKFHDFHNHGDIALISFQTYYGKDISIFWNEWPTHHSLSDDAIDYTHQSAHLGGGRIIYWP